MSYADRLTRARAIAADALPRVHERRAYADYLNPFSAAARRRDELAAVRNVLAASVPIARARRLRSVAP